MDIRRLKENADGTLAAAAYSPTRLVLIHTAAMLGLTLVLMAVNQLLSNSMGSAGGLSGMGTQSVLATAQVVLQLISMAVTPFWSAGLVNAAMGYVRRENVEPASLLEGFRRWKHILSSSLLIGMRYLGVAFIAVYLSSQLFVFTPFAVPLYEAALKMNGDPTSADLTLLLGDSLETMTAAYMVIFLIVFVVLSLPTYYRYRMVPYLIMDGEGMGGYRVMLTSRFLSRRHRMELFKVDLSFWWFYLGEIAISVLCVGYVILDAFGVKLPMSEDGAYWVFQLAAMACQLVLYCVAKPKMEVTFAHCYEALRNPEPEVIEAAPQIPKKHPWND